MIYRGSHQTTDFPTLQQPIYRFQLLWGPNSPRKFEPSSRRPLLFRSFCLTLFEREVAIFSSPRLSVCGCDAKLPSVAARVDLFTQSKYDSKMRVSGEEIGDYVTRSRVLCDPRFL